jgi:hypothetical protein
MSASSRTSTRSVGSEDQTPQAPARSAAPSLWVSLLRDGVLSFNQAVFEALGLGDNPSQRSVSLLYDPETRVLVLRQSLVACSRLVTKAAPTSYRVWAKDLFSSHGIDTFVSRRYDARFTDGQLVVDLKAKPIPVSRNRTTAKNPYGSSVATYITAAVAQAFSPAIDALLVYPTIRDEYDRLVASEKLHPRTARALIGMLLLLDLQPQAFHSLPLNWQQFVTHLRALPELPTGAAPDPVSSEPPAVSTT